MSESEKPLELQVTTSTSYKKPCLENKSTVYAGCQKFVYGNKDQALKQCGRNLSEYTLITKGIENEDPCLLKRSSPIILTNCKDKETKKNKAYFTDNARIKDQCLERIKQDRQWIGDGLEYKDLPSNFDSKAFNNFTQIVRYGQNDDKIRALTTLTFNIPYNNFYNGDDNSRLFYHVCLAGLAFVKGTLNNDPIYINMDKSTKDLLYAIYLLSPANLSIVLTDGVDNYTPADLFYKVFFQGEEGINIWKKIINFNYNINNILTEDKDIINTSIELIANSYIKPIKFPINNKLYYFTVVYNNPIDLKSNILERLYYIKNKNNLTYGFGAFNTNEDDGQRVLDFFERIIKETNPLVYKIRQINEGGDVSRLSFSPVNTNDKYDDRSNNNIEILNFSKDIGRHVLPYIALSISLYK